MKAEVFVVFMLAAIACASFVAQNFTAASVYIGSCFVWIGLCAIHDLLRDVHNLLVGILRGMK